MGSVLRERSIRSMPFHARLPPQTPVAFANEMVAHREEADVEQHTEADQRASRQGSGQNEVGTGEVPSAFP